MDLWRNSRCGFFARPFFPPLLRRYKDATRTAFKKPTRLECMMQDLPKLLSSELGGSARVGFTTMERWLSFSPAKNAPDAAALSAQAGAPPGKTSCCVSGV